MVVYSLSQWIGGLRDPIPGNDGLVFFPDCVVDGVDQPGGSESKSEGDRDRQGNVPDEADDGDTGYNDRDDRDCFVCEILVRGGEREIGVGRRVMEYIIFRH